MLTVLPGNSQLTASASGPQMPNHFCWPSTVIRKGVGINENGVRVAIQSVPGFSLIPLGTASARSCTNCRPYSVEHPKPVARSL